MNRLSSLPRGFGAFPALEVLDLTYNNLTEKSLPVNLFGIGQYIKSVILAIYSYMLDKRDNIFCSYI